MKNLSLPILFLALFLSQSAWGQALHAPKICDNAQLTLKNLSSQPQNFWFQYYGEKGFEEVHWVLEKFEVKTLTSEDLPAYEYSIKTIDASVVAVTRCGSELTPWTTRVSPLRHWTIRKNSAYKGYIQNLDPRAQTVMLRFLGPNKLVLGTQTVQLGGHLKTTDFKFWGLGVEVEAKAQGRISMVLQENKYGSMSYLKELPALPVKVDVDPTAVYFLLSNQQTSDSFTVKITDPVMIAKARNILKLGHFKLMVGLISYSSLSENRSLVHAETTPFSWRVDQVLNFNDLADISCDASPQNVQEKIFDWLSSRKICFWSYHLKKELTPREVQYGILNSQP